MQPKEYSYQYWMVQAVALAQKVKYDVPIAALIVKDNILISKGTNEVEVLEDATAHAEILAIKGAANNLGDWRLNGCTLYTTLEPCAMCTGAIMNSRVSKVVFGAYDLNAGACGSKTNLFKDLSKENHIEVIGGIMEFEASQILKSFFEEMRDG